MPRACRRFMREAGITYEVHRHWELERGSVLYFAGHTSFLDGFAISLACPEHLPLKRVIHSVSAMLLGKQFYDRNLTVFPRGSYRNWRYECHGWWSSLAYFWTHWWLPVTPFQGGKRTIQQALLSGSSVSIFPAGVVGETIWRTGIGAIVGGLPDENAMGDPIYLAPVSIRWDFEPHRVLVESPGLVRLRSLRPLWNQAMDRVELTEWLKKRYLDQDWPWESDRCEVRAPEAPFAKPTAAISR